MLLLELHLESSIVKQLFGEARLELVLTAELQRLPHAGLLLGEKKICFLPVLEVDFEH